MTRRTMTRRRVNWTAAVVLATLMGWVALCTWLLLLGVQAVFA